MIYKFNKVELDTEQFRLLVDKKETPVEPQVFNLIVFLIENKDTIVSRDSILDHIWKGRVVSDTSINNHIKSARKVLGDDGVKQQVIKTIHSRGYQFIAVILEDKSNNQTQAQTITKLPINKTPIIIGLFLLSIVLLITQYPRLFDNNSQVITQGDSLDRSIAVLAFKDLSPQSDQEYFSDGISEELLNLFTKIPNLRVASRTSSFSFKNQVITIEEIGKKLNVGYVLEGSVRKSGDKLRITVQLIQVKNGAHIWSETYNHNFTDIFKIQDEIALAVSQQLKIKLSNTKIRDQLINQDAYTLYLQAVYLLKENTEKSIKKSLELIGQSIAIDSNYSPAWVVYSRILYTVVIYSYKKSNKGAFILSKQAAIKAIEIDDTYANAYAQMALVNLLEWDTQSAQSNIDKALSLNSNSSSTVGIAAYNLQLRGQLATCVTMLEDAIALDPLYNIHYLNLGIAYLLLNRSEEAYQAVKKYAYFHPDAVAHHAMMSHILLSMGRNEEALVEAKLEVNEYWKLSSMSFATYAVGEKKLADELLIKYVEEYGQSIPGHIANLYAFRGEKDEAFKWLEAAYEKHDSGLLHMINFQTLRNLWDDPRWDAFLAKLNLPNGHWLIDKRING